MLRQRSVVEVLSDMRAGQISRLAIEECFVCGVRALRRKHCVVGHAYVRTFQLSETASARIDVSVVGVGSATGIIQLTFSSCKEC